MSGLMLEEMEVDGEITTTEAIIEPLERVIGGIKDDPAQRVCKFAH